MDDDKKEPEPVTPQDTAEPEQPQSDLPEMGHPELHGGRPDGVKLER